MQPTGRNVVRISPHMNGANVRKRLNRRNGRKAGHGVGRRRTRPEAGEGRIVVVMPDGTVLTVIGATRLLLSLSERAPTGDPSPA